MKLFHILTVIFIQAIVVTRCWALPFGSFDPNSLAMGGVGVALATGANASYFNPAMLARYSVRKEKAPNSRIIFPVVSARYSDTLKQMNDFKNNDLDKVFTDALAAFDPNNSATAQALVNAAADLQSGLNQVSSGPVDFDANAGFVIGIPSKHQGGAIFYNERLAGDGVVNQTAADRDLLNAFIADPAAAAAANPTVTFTSTANATAILMTEVGMSFAGEIHIRDHGVALGISPKYVKLTTYDLSVNATQNNLSANNEQIHDWAWNLDLGAETEFGNQWRAGLVIKNLFGRDYSTGLNNNKVHIGPQLRGGIAWFRGRTQIGVDLDLIRNDSIGAGDATQMLGIGGEWRASRYFQLMAGIQRNLRATGDQKAVLYSAGLKSTVAGVQGILSFAYNGVEKAAGVQFGYQF